MKSLLVLLFLFCIHHDADAQLNISGSFFDCPDLSNLGSAQTVHELKPTDIRVIGAMGDSLTAGFGILSPFPDIYTNSTDFRGLAWSGGGDGSIDYVTTLPNILKNYNPELYGFSEGTTPILNFTDLPNTRLNVARSGGHAHELLGQAQVLVEKMRANPDINMEEDWKLITILIGANDVCQFPCTNNPLGEPEIWIANITAALDYLEAELPRTYVNFVQLGNLDSAQRQVAMSGNPICTLTFNFICECGEYGDNSLGDNFSVYVRNYQSALEDLLNSGRYTSSNTFTVVLQPFLENIQLPIANGVPNIAFLASDCAHLSPLGNRLYATALWNNMLQPVGQKQSAIDFDAQIQCPTGEQPFFFTELNSSAAFFAPAVTLVVLVLVFLLAVSGV